MHSLENNGQGYALKCMCHFRECDKDGCNRRTGVFEIFLGRGHSYHPECLAPDLELDVCPICSATILTNLSTLAAEANNGVFKNGADGNQDDGNDPEDNGDDMDDDDDDDGIPQAAGIHNEMTDVDIDNFIMRLVNDINSWRRAVPP